MFQLSGEPLVSESVVTDDAGGFVCFEGKVRNHANGREVLRLEYEAYDDLAIPEGQALVREAIQKFGLVDARVTHRTGLLEIGETAVIIQVAAAHRREAFAGCEWIIDQLKHRVPIWKKEHFADGDSGWVGADAPTLNTDLADSISMRQRALDEVGEAGQAALRASRVLIVGVGGLASGSVPYLAGAGVGTIGLVDSDEVDITNLHRQILYTTADRGRLKVDRAASFVLKLNPTITVRSHPEFLNEGNAERLVKDYDWIVDGTDSLETKFLLNEVCHRSGKHLVTASVHRFEGQLMTIAPDGPCLRCLFPTEPPTRCVSNCAETGVLGVVPGLFGLLQANEVLKGILGYGLLLTDHLQLIDLRTGDSQRLTRSKRADCPVCLNQPEHKSSEWEVSDLSEAATRFGSFRVIDIRELDEGPDLNIPHDRIPMSRFLETPGDEAIILVCASGARSLQLVARLRAKGRQHVLSLRGGTSTLFLENPSC